MPLRYHAPILSCGFVVVALLLIGADGAVPPDFAWEISKVLLGAALAWGAVRADVRWLIKSVADMRDELKDVHKRLNDHVRDYHTRG